MKNLLNIHTCKKCFGHDISITKSLLDVFASDRYICHDCGFTGIKKDFYQEDCPLPRNDNSEIISHILKDNFLKIYLKPIKVIEVPKDQAEMTITFENIADMYREMQDISVDKDPLFWISHPDLTPQICRFREATGTKNIPAFSSYIEDGKDFDTLFGIPIIWYLKSGNIGEVGDLGLFNINKYFRGEKSIILLDERL